MPHSIGSAAFLLQADTAERNRNERKKKRKGISNQNHHHRSGCRRPYEPEYWTEEEEGVLNELVAYAESVAGAIAGKTKKKFDECIFMHTMRIAKCMSCHECFSEAIEFLADILRVRGNEDTGKFLEGLTEYLEYDEDFCEYFLDVLFKKLADESDDYAFLCEEDCHEEM